MRTWDPKAEEIMKERFGRNRLIALATAVDGIPYVRNVTAYYEGGSFYIITDARSEKMKQIAKNPTAARWARAEVCWSARATGHATGTWYIAGRRRTGRRQRSWERRLESGSMISMWIFPMKTPSCCA